MHQVYGPFISWAQAKEKGLKHYFDGTPCKRQHISVRLVSTKQCCECLAQRYQQNREAVIERSKKNYEDNREHRKAVMRLWRVKNKAHKQAMDRAWVERNPDRKRKRDKEYRIANRQRLNRAQAVRYAQDHQYRVVVTLRNSVNRYVGQKSTTGRGRTFDLVGCSPLELCKHLADKFLPGMTWENHGEWHIDHIRPCASFDLTDPEQQKQCFHFSNLQPLWAVDNLRKNAKWSPDAEGRTASRPAA